MSDFRPGHRRGEAEGLVGEFESLSEAPQDIDVGQQGDAPLVPGDLGPGVPGELPQFGEREAPRLSGLPYQLPGLHIGPAGRPCFADRTGTSFPPIAEAAPLQP
ncbi:hypothetical protein GCM10010277_86690 [Streptomyces longisporoflavus]|nr:hypothetical protein GCM10010277_86690 [Streptomyces longisporoflavus]